MAWGLVLSAAVHGLLWLLFVRGVAHPPRPQARPGAVLTVALLAPPAPAPAAAATAPEAAPETLPPVPEVAAEPVREEIHYYFPEELERQLIVLRDHSGEAEIDLPDNVIMNLFVDVSGHVAAITFDGDAPDPALQAKLRQAFMSMEFMPGMKQGRPVPARIKIGIAPLLVPPAPRSEIN